MTADGSEAETKGRPAPRIAPALPIAASPRIPTALRILAALLLCLCACFRLLAGLLDLTWPQQAVVGAAICLLDVRLLPGVDTEYARTTSVHDVCAAVGATRSSERYSEQLTVTA